MHTIKRSNAAFIVILGMLMAMVAFSSPASASPYTHKPSISVSTQTPRMGAKFRLCGKGFHARSTVKITLDRRIFLGTRPTNRSGAFCATVKLPNRVSGGHRLWARDQYRHSASAWIRIVRHGAHSVKVAGVSLSADTTSADTTSSGTTVAGVSASEATTSNETTSADSLAFTGATVIGLGALGGVLLVGGGLMLYTGRRRKSVS